MERGNISVSTENIFPIIKKSLYADQEIFLRELIANAVDASQKIRYLSSMGEFQGELGELEIRVRLDKEAKTLTISDRGLGMNAEEVKKYLNQVAFSGAEEFLKKFKDAEQNEDIIGKFGLGFYSAFMVASEVEVVSQSYREDDPGIRWTCDGSTTYTLEEGQREDRGTDIILHVMEDAEEFLEEARIKNILNKYCKFLPVNIYFHDEQINQTEPAWKKPPTELTDEDYQGLFRELYPFAEDPLFWIHLNVDYPFNLTGILYFPKIRQDIDPKRNNIQLYSRQVFITDEVSEIVPDFLMLLQGVIDSPDIPLNVSRSYLQSDSNVRKISNYITRKVADKLNELFKEDREAYEEKWPNIAVFVKYGMITDDKFYDRVHESALLEDVEEGLFTLEEFNAKITPLHQDKDEKRVYLYASDKKSQDIYIQAAQDKSYEVLFLGHILDPHFIGLMERKVENSRWVRVDSDTVDKLIPKSEEAEEDGLLMTEEQLSKIKEAFVAILPQKEMQVQTERLGPEQMPVLVTRPEFMRRMKDMAAMGGGGMNYMGEMPDAVNVVVNTQHPLVVGMIDGRKNQDLAKQLLDLALLSQHMLEGKDLTAFIKRSVEMLEKKKKRKSSGTKKENKEGK